MLQPPPEKRKQNCSSKVEENHVSPRYFCSQVSFTNQSLSTPKLTYLVRCEIPFAPIKLNVLKKSWPTPHLQSRKHASMLVAWVLICNDPRINISQIWRWTGELKPSRIITQQHYVYMYIFIWIYIYIHSLPDTKNFHMKTACDFQCVFCWLSFSANNFAGEMMRRNTGDRI